MDISSLTKLPSAVYTRGKTASVPGSLIAPDLLLTTEPLASRFRRAEPRGPVASPKANRPTNRVSRRAGPSLPEAGTLWRGGGGASDLRRAFRSPEPGRTSRARGGRRGGRTSRDPRGGREGGREGGAGSGQPGRLRRRLRRHLQVRGPLPAATAPAPRGEPPPRLARPADSLPPPRPPRRPPRSQGLRVVACFPSEPEVRVGTTRRGSRWGN